MPSWKKVLVSGSNAHLNHVTSSGNFSGSYTSTGSFGTIRSAGLPLYVGDTKVGIGVTNPGDYNSVGNTLVVGNTAGNAGITIASNASNYGTLYFADNTSGTAEYDGAVEYNHASQEMHIWTNGASPKNLILKNDGDVTLGANISASLSSTGSFGRLVTTGYGNVMGGQQGVPNLTIKNNYDNINTSFGGGDTYQLSLYGNGGSTGNFEVKYGVGTTYNHWMKIMGNGGNDGTLDIHAGSDSNGLGKVSIMRTGVSGSSISTGSFGRVELTTIGAFKAEGAIDFNNENMTNVDIDSGTITGITDLAVADGGTGASTFTDGGVLLGSGTDAITAMAALGDGEMIVGDGSGDPVAESGATLRTSIGVGAGDTPTFAGLNTTGDIVIEGSLTANSYIVSSSVTHLTSSFSSGSTIFGDDTGDTHQFTGSLFVTSTPLTIDTDGTVSGSSTSTGSFGRVIVDDVIIDNGDVTLPATKKLYLDGGNDTYITEGSSNQIQFFTNGNLGFGQDATGHVFIQATDAFYYDGGSNTFRKEKSADVLVDTVGGVETLTLTTTAISGSSITTGSFGSLVVSDKVQGDLTLGGNVTPSGDNAKNLGGASNVWANIYGYDIHGTRNISGSSTSTGSFGHVYVDDHLAATTFRIDGNKSSQFLGIIDNDQSSAGHVLKLATDGTGNGTYVLDMENGSNTMFRARADGRFAFGNSAVSSMGAGTFVVGIDGGHTSDIAISKRLQHLGDGDTYLDFETNNIIFSAGGNLLDYSTTKLSGSAATHLTMGQISSSGDVVADGDIIAYNASDRELKDNLQVIQGSLDKIGEINGYEFDWNDKSPGWAKERGHDVGVVAQEVQKILPEVVTERKNGYLGVDYKRLVPLLIESIKELKEEVEILKKKVN